jgi:hypothetical protein
LSGRAKINVAAKTGRNRVTAEHEFYNVSGAHEAKQTLDLSRLAAIETNAFIGIRLGPSTGQLGGVFIWVGRGARLSDRNGASGGQNGKSDIFFHGVTSLKTKLF